MSTHRNVGAAAPGQTAPERTRNDEPRELAGEAGSKCKALRVSLDCATGAVWVLAVLSWIVWIVLSIGGQQ